MPRHARREAGAISRDRGSSRHAAPRSRMPSERLLLEHCRKQTLCRWSLGEINDGQREAWCRQIEAFDEASGRHRQLALFPAERTVPDHAKGFGVQVRLDAMELHRRLVVPQGVLGGTGKPAVRDLASHQVNPIEKERVMHSIQYRWRFAP
jgi:hypothetical protein